ncbi:anhydro-N-acetylmuramic acid kinase [Streptomyces sp. YIM 130001]|uniref:GNAT family N-acetyltransferase n=1 Tax=Streptomyces sp. YIM 130001 TaxID=2259644 RepID=UPI000E6571F8|nr:GNAT family N-acetyltransferase [Streptomyces sp. YIM 130001]RII11680.1 anhydro-N-acetylmuramic acid kinase [Streptomyces sp. YIM 130001]
MTTTKGAQGGRTLATARMTLTEIDPTQATALSVGGPGGFDWITGGPVEGTRAGAGFLAKAASEGRYRAGWGMYVLVRDADGLALGAMGFHGAPADGRVEVGYDLVPAARGDGYATEALRALSAWALADPAVTTVVARSEPSNTASRAVLARAGFTLTRGPETTDDHGEVVTYELARKTGPSGRNVPSSPRVTG